MPVKIRLQRKGRRKRPFYHIVVADARAPRDGRFIEKLGTYNPMTTPATIDVDVDSAYEWLMKGAQPTDTARAILRFKGVMYRKHLQRGVSKGALTQEDADAKWQEWIDAKESRLADRFEATAQAKLDYHAKVSGTPPPPPAPKPEPVAEETVVEIPAAADEAASEEAPAAEAAPAAEEVKAEAPAAEEAAAEAPAEEAAPAAEEAKAEVATEEAPAEEEEKPAE
ncbi:MAG: 30S ribosomal protein S16 [Saprospiraceae bacterium]